MGWIGCIRCEKFWCDFMAQTFCINWITSACFPPSLITKWNIPKCTRALWNAPKHEFRGPMGWIGCSRSEKLRCDFVARTFALIALVQPVLHWLYFRNKTIPNAPKHCETHQNKSLWSFGVDRVCSLWEVLKRLLGTNFCINCTSSAHFALSFVQ